METLAENQQWHQVAEVQLVYRHAVKPSQRPRIECSRDVFNLLRNSWNEDKIEFIEEFKVLLLDRRCRAMGLINLSSGGTASTVVDIKLIFMAVIKANASQFILAHNHPSGNLQPSQQDLKLTKEIALVGKALDMTLADHFIITSESYLSFADSGNL